MAGISADKESDNEYVAEVNNLSVHYEVDGEVVRAVNNVRFSLKRGRIMGLVGETGAGKTTVALSMLRLVPDPPGIVDSGEIVVCGYDIMKASKRELEKKIRGDKISMIFQDPMTSLNPVFTVGEQIAESYLFHDSVSKAEALEKANEILEMVGIPKERSEEYPHQFSGGMRQRVGIAIALACRPELLIADEPTTALDVTIQAQVLDLIRNLRKELNMSMIMITHDLGIVAEICDEVAVMYAGHIVERGTLEEVFNHTRHPYTEGLFGSLPNMGDRTVELMPIPGLMPDPTNLPEGCAFAPRCRYASDKCVSGPPPEVRLSDTHFVVCTLHAEGETRLERKDR
jgi:peptide/nickel transport system ATP-binding protein